MNVYIFVLFLIIKQIYSLDPSCVTCKNYVPSKIRADLGLCNIFKETYYPSGEVHHIKNFAVHCRNNENLCGKSGFLYQPINKKKLVNINYIRSLIPDEYDNIKNYNELVALEKDLDFTFKQMKKHNLCKI